MASGNSLVAASPFAFTDNVYALIERSFLGSGGPEAISPIQAAFRHHFSVRGGGSRIRLTRKCAEALSLITEDSCSLASVVECLHNASLVQDDLQDRSAFRRGQPTVVDRFGADVALGLTDRLITTAFACLSHVSDSSRLPSLIAQINRAVSETVEGQTSELAESLSGRSVDGHLSAARKKSGPLFALSLELPLILAGHPDAVEAAHEAACRFGLGYQILDDLKDQTSDRADGCSGNIVFAMKKNHGSNCPARTAAGMAKHLLQDASVRAKHLPLACGEPLVELVCLLSPQIDAFNS